MSALSSADPPPAPIEQRSLARRRWVATGTALLVVLLATALLWGGALDAGSSPEDGDGGAAVGAQEEIVRGTLEGDTTVSGTLRFAESRTITAGGEGTVTALPVPAAVVGRGDELYAIDAVPTFLLVGPLPAWRDFVSGMTDGPDVAQLEANLWELGHFAEEPDGRFRWSTAAAIRDWQEANDLPMTGELPLGSVVFAPGELRIGAVTTEIGARVGVGAELLDVTSTSQAVEANLRLADQSLGAPGTPVTVRLPGGQQISGAIGTVGTPAEVDGANGQKQTVIPIMIVLDDPTWTGSLQQATVSVDIPSERREDVLHVPVSALVAITPEQFGVEVVDSDGIATKVPVQTGLFAGGRVEIRGDGIDAGQRVVVPR